MHVVLLRRPAAAKIAWPLVAWSLFTIALLAYFIRISPDAARVFYYNSDHLYPAALYNDLLGGNDLWGWRFPPSPYVFPDLVLYFLLRSLLPTLHLTLPAYGVTQTLLFLAGLILLGRRLFPAATGRIHLFVVLAAALYFSLLVHLPHIFSYILVGVFHTGVMVVMPYAILLALRFIDSRSESRRKQGTAAACLFLITALTTASDLLYIVQVVLPLSIALLVLAGLRHLSVGRLLWVMVVQVTGVVAGLAGLFAIVSPAFAAQYFTANGADATVMEAARNLWTWLVPMASKAPYLAAAWLAFIGISLFILIASLVARDRYPQLNRLPVVLAACFLLALVIGSILAGLVSGNILGRYFLPTLLLPAVFGWPFLLAPLSLRFAPREAVGALGAILLVATFVIWRDLPHLPRAPLLGDYLDYYPPIVQCMDTETERRGLRNGIAQYWQARPLTLLSRNKLHVAQVLGTLDPFYWNNNIETYDREFDFVVMDPTAPVGHVIEAQTLHQAFGPPSDTFTCEESTIFVYDGPADHHLRDHPLVRHELARLGVDGDHRTTSGR